MGFFNRKKIQASAPEGQKQDVLLEALLSGEAVNKSIPGIINAYKSYDSQVNQTYKKYNGQSDFGTQQTRAIIDLRTAFLSGEGVNVSAANEKTGKWIEEFIRINKLDSLNLVNAVKGAEMCGQALFKLQFVNDNVKVRRLPYDCDQPYRAVYTDDYFQDELKDILVKKRNGKEESLGVSNFIYVRTGGDDVNFWGPTTRVGLVLTDIENYDRAIKDQRRLNHIVARVTPVFKTQAPDGVKTISDWLSKSKWKIGKSYIGSADFEYKAPNTGAHDILNIELVSTIKTISAVTGVPVHWLGYVDLMSNRSTAETLYEVLKNATSNERVIWEDALWETIYKAQELYINKGGKKLGKLDSDFQVRLPLLDFSNFLDRVRAYSIALKDEVISLSDYRNGIPGINPIDTERELKKEKEEAEKEIADKIYLEEEENGESSNNGGRFEEKENGGSREQAGNKTA